MSGIDFVLDAEGPSESGFFVGEDEDVRCQPGKYRVDEEVGIAQQEGLSENQ